MLYQYDVSDPMNPLGLLMAYAEETVPGTPEGGSVLTRGFQDVLCSFQYVFGCFQTGVGCFQTCADV